MAQYRFPRGTSTRAPAELDDEGAQRQRGVADRVHSAADSDSASGYESSSDGQSPSPTLEGRQRSCASIRPLASQSFSADNSASGLHFLREASRDGIESTQQQERQQPATTAASTTAVVTRTATKIATGTAYIAPRRLRSQVPPRVNWVRGKFIRQLGSDEQRTTQLVSLLTRH